MDYTAENELSKIILGCAIEVHKQLGPGLLESAYQECLLYELFKAGLEVVNGVEPLIPVLAPELLTLLSLLPQELSVIVSVIADNVSICLKRDFISVSTSKIYVYERIGLKELNFNKVD